MDKAVLLIRRFTIFVVYAFVIWLLQLALLRLLRLDLRILIASLMAAPKVEGMSAILVGDIHC